MERRLQPRKNVHHIEGKTIVISNHQRTRQLGVRTLRIHHSLGKKQQQDNYIQPLSSGKYRSYVSRKQHSNKTTVDNIKTTKQKRTSTWCNHKWPNTSHQRETKKQWRNNAYHRRQWNLIILIGRNRKSMQSVQTFWPTLPTAWRINRRTIPHQWVRQNVLFLRHCQTTTLHKIIGSTAFNELTTSYHKDFYIDILSEGIMKRIEKSNITIYKEYTIQ